MFWMVCLAWMLPLCVKADNMIISMGSLLVNAQFQEFRFEEGTDQKHSVHIKKPGRLTIEFKNENAGNYIRVFSKETAKDVLYYEECLMEGSEEKPEMFSFSLDLMPGEYYLLHENIGNTGYYEVKASFIPALSEETESNNTEESAMPLVYGKTIHGFISSDPVQWENSV